MWDFFTHKYIFVYACVLGSIFGKAEDNVRIFYALRAEDTWGCVCVCVRDTARWLLWTYKQRKGQQKCELDDEAKNGNAYEMLRSVVNPFTLVLWAS